MGNSSTSFLPDYSCLDSNLSRNSVTPQYWDSHSISEDFRISSLLSATAILLFLLVGLPSNVIIIISIIQQMLYKGTTHLLLLNLAISDFLVCLLVMPFITITGFAGSFIFGESDYIRCQLCQTGVILTILYIFSLNILCLISIDRFIFVKFPLRYEVWVTKCRVMTAVVLMWLLAIAEGILPVFGVGEIKYGYTLLACTVRLEGVTHVISNRSYGALLLILQVIPIIVIIITNIWIACIARDQIKKIYRTRRSFGNPKDLQEYNRSIRQHIHKRRNKKQLVLIRTFGAILIANFVVWMPIMVLVVILVVVDSDSIPLGFYTLAFPLLLMHSALHPLIEGCFIPEIKATFKKFTGVSLCFKLITKGMKAGDNTDPTGEETTEQTFSGKYCCDVCSVAMLPD